MRAAIHHRPPDRVPLDLGPTTVTGIVASTYARLRPALGEVLVPGQLALREDERGDILAYPCDDTSAPSARMSRGGHVFNPVHNARANVPAESMMAMSHAVRQA